MSDKKPEVYQWKFIDYFVTIAIGVMPFFALILIFLQRPKYHKTHMLIAGLIGFAILYTLINIL